MICDKCNFDNEETAKFCRNCGTKLLYQQIQQAVETKTCSKCGFQNSDNVRFCGKCGIKLYADEKSKQKEQVRLWRTFSFIFAIVLFFSIFIVIDATITSKNIEQDLVETGFAPKYIEIIVEEGSSNVETSMESVFNPGDTAIYRIDKVGIFGKLFDWSAQIKLIVSIGGLPGSYIASPEERGTARKEVIVLTQDKIHKTRAIAIWLSLSTGFMLIMTLLLKKGKKHNHYKNKL